MRCCLRLWWHFLYVRVTNLEIINNRCTFVTPFPRVFIAFAEFHAHKLLPKPVEQSLALFPEGRTDQERKGQDQNSSSQLREATLLVPWFPSYWHYKEGLNTNLRAPPCLGYSGALWPLPSTLEAPQHSVLAWPFRHEELWV